MFQTTVVFKANMDATCKYVVNQGGTSSGKTYAIVQLLFTLAMRYPNTVITVAGQDMPNLKKGAYRDAIRIYYSSGELRQWFGKPNQTDRLFTCRNGSIIEFSSFSDEQDARSGKRDYLFVNTSSDGGFAMREYRRNDTQSVTSEAIADAVKSAVQEVKIYTAIEDINKGQAQYAVIANDNIF